MTLRNAAGDILNKTELTALTTQAPAVAQDRILTAAVYESYSLPGEGDRYQTGKRLKFRAGQRITQVAFDALFAPATVTAISPSTGPAVGNTNFTATGTNLSGVEGVTFDGVAATNVKVVNNTTVTGTTPANSAGTSDVVFKDDNADVSKPALFTFVWGP